MPKLYKNPRRETTVGEANAITIAMLGRDKLMGVIAGFRLPIFSKFSHVRSDIESLWADGSLKEAVCYFVGRLKANGRENAREIVVPLTIRNGKIIDPAIFMQNGRYEVLAKENIDNLFRGEQFTNPVMDRPNIFSPPNPPGIIVPTRTLPDFYSGEVQ